MEPGGFSSSWSSSVFNVRCRQITIEDSDEVLTWRNDLASRQTSLNPGIISPIEHLNWFRDMLQNKAHVGYIGELNYEKIGVIFMKFCNRYAKISINMNPIHRSKGLGGIFLKSAISTSKKSLPKIQQFSAEIKNTNTASIKIFAHNGFKLQTKKDGFSVYCLKI